MIDISDLTHGSDVYLCACRDIVQYIGDPGKKTLRQGGKEPEK